MKNVTELRSKHTGMLTGTYQEVMHALSGGGAIVEFFPSDLALDPEAMTADLMRRPTIVDAVRALPITDQMVGEWCTIDVSVEGIAERLAMLAKPIVDSQAPLDEAPVGDLVAALRTDALPRVLGVMVESESYRSASAHSAGLAFRAIRDGKFVGLGAPLGHAEDLSLPPLSQDDARVVWLASLEATLNAPTFPYHLSHVLGQMVSAGTAGEAAK